jgi:hypothetical protein
MRKRFLLFDSRSYFSYFLTLLHHPCMNGLTRKPLMVAKGIMAKIFFLHTNTNTKHHYQEATSNHSDYRTVSPFMCCSSTQRSRAFAGRHVFVLASSSGLRGYKRTYLPILVSADHALFKMVKYVILRPRRLELDAKTKTCLPAKTCFCHLY